MAKGNRSQTCHVCSGTAFISGKGHRDTAQIVLTVPDHADFATDQLRASHGDATVQEFLDMCDEAMRDEALPERKRPDESKRPERVSI